jgi:hypothetical protein
MICIESGGIGPLSGWWGTIFWECSHFTHIFCVRIYSTEREQSVGVVGISRRLFRIYQETSVYLPNTEYEFITCLRKVSTTKLFISLFYSWTRRMSMAVLKFVRQQLSFRVLLTKTIIFFFWITGYSGKGWSRNYELKLLHISHNYHVDKSKITNFPEKCLHLQRIRKFLIREIWNFAEFRDNILWNFAEFGTNCSLTVYYFFHSCLNQPFVKFSGKIFITLSLSNYVALLFNMIRINCTP